MAAIAPAGHRTWVTGEVVTQALQQTFLQDQTVIVGTTSERDALTVNSGSEGTCLFNTTTNTFEAYSGTGWVPLLDIDTLSVASGAYTYTGAVTLGVNDTGVDLTCYGATDGAYMKWC